MTPCRPVTGGSGEMGRRSCQHPPVSCSAVSRAYCPILASPRARPTGGTCQLEAGAPPGSRQHPVRVSLTYTAHNTGLVAVIW